MITLKEFYQSMGPIGEGSRFIVEFSSGDTIKFEPKDLTPVLHHVYENVLRRVRSNSSLDEREEMLTRFADCLREIDGSFKRGSPFGLETL